jgi:ribosomal protein S18 acetylase RimI-like enzyme
MSPWPHTRACACARTAGGPVAWRTAWHNTAVTISITDLELAAAPSWRAPDEARLGDWLLRAAGGFTGRANSALAADDPGLPLAGAIEAVTRWYAARGLPPTIAVPYPIAQPERTELDQILAGLGWTVRADAATVMTATTADVAGYVRPGAAVAIDPVPDAGWLGQYHYRGQPLPTIAVRLLTSASWQAFASIREGGETIAIGRVAGSGDWAGLTAIEVDPDHYRRGLGTAVTAALAAHAANRGFRNLYLQVTDGNFGARSLYRQLGFTDHHGYHYRVSPT